MYDSFSSFLQPILPTVEHLYVIDEYALRHWQREIEKSELPELLHPFTAVKNLYLSREIVIYHASPAKTPRGKNGRSVTHPAEKEKR
jgi:hypothetical protein